MQRRKPAPSWSPAELDIVRTGWPAGVSMDDLICQLPGRTPRAVQLRAHQLGVRRPKWFTDEARSRGGFAGAMVRQGRRDYWSANATTRLLTVTKERGVEEAARACGVSVAQAKGRLYRIGFRLTEEKPPETDEPEFVEPTLPETERIDRLVARFETTTRGRLSLAIPT